MGQVARIRRGRFLVAILTQVPLHHPVKMGGQIENVNNALALGGVSCFL